MQALGYVLLARILFATLVLDQISSQAIERRIETMDLAEARQALTKSSVEVKTLVGLKNNNGMAGFIGARFSLFLTPNVFLGGGGYGGRLFGSAPGADTIGYGGILAGAELPLGETFVLEGSTLFGGGGAKYQADSGPMTDSTLVVEPQIALIAKFRRGVRVGAQASYISFSSLQPLSGVSMSVFVDFRRFSLSIPD